MSKGLQTLVSEGECVFQGHERARGCLGDMGSPPRLGGWVRELRDGFEVQAQKNMGLIGVYRAECPMDASGKCHLSPVTGHMCEFFKFTREIPRHEGLQPKETPTNHSFHQEHPN